MLLKRCTLLAFLYWCCIHPLSAQHISQTVSMPYIALGTYSSAQADAFAFTINPAALAQQKAPAAGVYTERRFLLSEATAYRAALALPTRMGHWGLQLNRFGFTHFSENALALAYARSLGRKVELGIQFSYHGYQVFTHGNASTIGSAAGVLLHLTPRLQAGIAVCNPIAMPFSQASGHKLATAVRLGMGYEASEQLLLTADIRKEEGSALHTTVGVQYQMGQHLFARGGFASATPQMLMGFAGFGVGWQQWRLHLSGSWHPQLRWSPALVCLVQFKQLTNAQP